MAGRWFFLGTPVSSTNKADHHDITEILLKVALNSIKPNITKPAEINIEYTKQMSHFILLDKYKYKYVVSILKKSNK